MVKPAAGKNSTANRSPAKQLHDLSFLTLRPGQDVLVDCLHEGQASLLVTGRSDSEWTAYLLKDAYQHSDVIPLINALPSLSTMQEEPCIDPLMRKTLGISVATTDPKEYLHVVLRAWIGEIGEEWRNTIYHLNGRVAACVSPPS